MVTNCQNIERVIMNEFFYRNRINYFIILYKVILFVYKVL